MQGVDFTTWFTSADECGESRCDVNMYIAADELNAVCVEGTIDSCSITVELALSPSKERY